MQETTLPLDDLLSVRGKPVIARFDGGMLSSDTGVLALGEIERRLRRIVEMKTQVRVSLPSACPDEALLRLLLQRIPRLVT